TGRVPEQPSTAELETVQRPQDRSTEQAPAKRQDRLAQDQAPAADEKEPLVAATREVLAAIVNRGRRRHNANGLDGDEINGDELTEGYVRAAAEAALKLPAERRLEPFFWGLAIGLERTEEMRRYAVLGDFIRQVETDAQRRLRLAILGSPAWGRREDLSQQITFSAAIAVTAGRRAAEAAGMAKELRDARAERGFSFVDWCADRAGIAWANQVKKGSITLEMLASRFKPADYLPDVEGLEEGLSWDEFSRRYGSTSDRRFRAVDADILSRIDRLYRSPRHAGSASR
ncbi:MAG TPA: hypothetical protein VGN42_08320, partial [Pirellulales bacterium]|nr:hypothetical protein [Pirellulales bacterium]